MKDVIINWENAQKRVSNVAQSNDETLNKPEIYSILKILSL